MLTYHQDDMPIIIFSDECRVCNQPDNKERWVLINDFREANCAEYTSYKFSTMMWAPVRIDFKSQLIFPRGKIDEKKYRENLKESLVFEDADDILGHHQYIFQQDEVTSHTTLKSYKFIERKARMLYG